MDDLLSPLPEPEDPVLGCVGTVVVATRGVAGAGEVLVGVRGGREAYLAWSVEPLVIGTTVLIIGVRSGRTVDVEPWDQDLLVTRL